MELDPFDGTNKATEYYYYNYQGQRIRKEEDNGYKTDYYYSGSMQIYTAESLTDDLLTQNIVTPVGRIIASQRYDNDSPVGWYFYNYDIRQSTTTILNVDFGAEKSYKYDEFGNTVESGSLLNEIAYTSAVSDSNTGLYYMNARYYNPNTGRFLTQDSYKGSIYEPWTQNLYSYVGNNPVNFVDPTGHNPILIAAVIVLGSALIGGIIGGIFSASRGDGFLSGAAGGAVSGSLGSLGAVAMFFSGGTMSPAVFTLLGLSGFAGGYEGSVVLQTVGKQIDDDVSLSEAYKAVDHDEALYNGIIGGASNIASGVFAGAFSSGADTVDDLVRPFIESYKEGFRSGIETVSESTVREVNKAAWIGTYSEISIQTSTYNFIQQIAVNAIDKALSSKSSSSLPKDYYVGGSGAGMRTKLLR